MTLKDAAAWCGVATVPAGFVGYAVSWMVTAMGWQLVALSAGVVAVLLWFAWSVHFLIRKWLVWDNT